MVRLHLKQNWGLEYENKKTRPQFLFWIKIRMAISQMDSAVGDESSVLGIFPISEHKIGQFGIERDVPYQVSEFLSSLPQEKVCLN